MINTIFKTALTFLFIGIITVSCSSKKVKQDNNPFTFEKTGLPVQTSFCGVGLPDLISSDLADNIIGQVFRDNGFKLTKNYLYKTDSSSFVLNGYDKNKKTGYVYLEYNNLEDDAVIPWDEDSFALFYEPDKFGSEVENESESQRLSRWLENQSGDNIKNMINYMNRNLLASEKELIAEVQKSNDENFIRAAYSKLYQKQRKYTVSLDEIKRTIRDAGKDGIYIAVISVYDKALAVYPDFEMDMPMEEVEPDTTKEKDKYTQEDALDYLKKNVETFVEWSRS